MMRRIAWALVVFTAGCSSEAPSSASPAQGAVTTVAAAPRAGAMTSSSSQSVEAPDHTEASLPPGEASALREPAPNAAKSAAASPPSGEASSQGTDALETVEAMLLREIGAGRSVAVIGGTRGLRAISSDGERERVLVPSPVWFVLVDTRSRVIWYGVERQIRALDLEATAVAEIQVLDHVPFEPGMVGPLNIAIAYPKPERGTPVGLMLAKAESFALDGGVVSRSATLAIWPDRAPQVLGDGGYEQDEEFDEAIEEVTVPGARFVRSLVKREHASPPPGEYKVSKVSGIDPTNCEDEDECGTATEIPGTGFARVVTGSASGDIRHVSLALFDRGTQKIVPGSESWFSQGERMWLAPDHSAFVISGAVVRYADGPLSSTKLGECSGGGFLGGVPFF